MKTIEILQCPDFLPNVRQVGKQLLEGLQKLTSQYPFIREVRGVGLMIGVEIFNEHNQPDNGTALTLQKILMEQGMIVRVSERGRVNVMEIRPALIATERDASEILQRFEAGCLQMS